MDPGDHGQGVDVALIDSGVAPVQGLTAPGKVINGADLSFEQGADHLRYMDTYGHGTHLAGLIAGRDADWSPSNHDSFSGVAPDARIVNVKVANAMGATDVSQVIAAIDWVVQHKNDNGMNIRVLNLSFGTDGVQNYVLDPLTYAAEVAWRKGIVVVAAAGNSQFGNQRAQQPRLRPIHHRGRRGRYPGPHRLRGRHCPAVVGIRRRTRGRTSLLRASRWSAFGAPVAISISPSLRGSSTPGSCVAAERRRRRPWSRAQWPCCFSSGPT